MNALSVSSNYCDIQIALFGEHHLDLTKPDTRFKFERFDTEVSLKVRQEEDKPQGTMELRYPLSHI